MQNGHYLDVLVNNAGISPPETKERTMCTDNPDWEITVATNCLGPLLLTDLLLDNLKDTAATKVSIEYGKPLTR